MNYQIKDQRIVIVLPDSLSSANSEAFQDECNHALEGKGIEEIVLDASHNRYISSAGLRVILFLTKRYSKVSIKDVDLSVYDVLEMTGFTKLVEVHRKLEEVDVSGMKVIGEGRAGIVYRVNKDTILKVYKRKIEISNIEREMALSREAFVLGIPTAITFDIVKVGDTLASRFEMLDCATLGEVMKHDIYHLDQYLDEYAKLLLKINHTTSDTLDLPSKKDKWLEHVSYCLPYLDDSHGKKLRALIEGIEDKKTFVHGDCHIKNIMSDGKNLYLIDMGALSTGHPIFELGALYRTFFGFDFIEPGNTERFFGLDRDTLDRIFYGTLTRYLEHFDDEVLDKIALVGLVYLISWNSRYEGGEGNRAQDAIARLIPLVEKLNDLKIPLK